MLEVRRMVGVGTLVVVGSLGLVGDILDLAVGSLDFEVGNLARHTVVREVERRKIVVDMVKWKVGSLLALEENRPAEEDNQPAEVGSHLAVDGSLDFALAVVSIDFVAADMVSRVVLAPSGQRVSQK